MRTGLKNSPGGFSLVEAIIWVGIASLGAIITTSFFRGSIGLTRSTLTLASSAEPWTAFDWIQKDLREADAEFFPFTTLAGSADGFPGWFAKHSANDTGAPSYVRYDFEAGPLTTIGSLVRTYNDAGPTVVNSTRTVVFTSMMAPTASTLFLQRDPYAPNVVLVTIVARTVSPGLNPTSLRHVRRITLRT